MPFLLALKYLFKNKRYVMFTIFPVIAWYCFLAKALPLRPEAVVIYCILIGISGNCITTLSKRVANERPYYALQQRLTHYGRWHYIRDQIGLQLLSNAAICVPPIMIGCLNQWLTLTPTLFAGLMITLILSLIWSIVGFVLGRLLKSTTLDMLSLPMMLVLVVLMVPFSEHASFFLADVVRALQLFFPSHYVLALLSQLGDGVLWLKFLGTSCLCVAPFLVWFVLGTRQKS